MTGAGVSPVDGVRGRFTSVSSFGCTLDGLFGEATWAGGGGSRTGALSELMDAALEAGRCFSSTACWLSATGCRSGLVVLAEFFLDLKMPMILPPGEGERRVGLCGGKRLVAARPSRDSLESAESDR